MCRHLFGQADRVGYQQRQPHDRDDLPRSRQAGAEQEGVNLLLCAVHRDRRSDPSVAERDDLSGRQVGTSSSQHSHQAITAPAAAHSH